MRKAKRERKQYNIAVLLCLQDIYITERKTVYFSERNENTVYINHYSGLLEVEGQGDLTIEDSIVSPAPGKNWANDYDTLSFTEGITEIKKGYLEAFPKIGCLILSRTVVSVETTPELDKKYRKNKVLIRGEYDTYAEEFAREKGLRFLHSDILLADYYIEAAYEHDIVTLRFHADSAPDIHYNIFTPGSSAGSYGGGEVANKLPRDFYVGCTIEMFAEYFHEERRATVMANETLRRFLEAANRRLKKK